MTFRETEDEAADKLEMVIGQMARIKEVQKMAADMAKGLKQYCNNHGLVLADIKYAAQHMAKDPESLDTLFEDEDAGLRDRRHVLDVLRRRKTPLEKMIAKAKAGMPGADASASPSASASPGGGNVTPLHPPGRA